jgi:hypothetical protein
MFSCSVPITGPVLSAPIFRESSLPVVALALGSVSGLALAVGGALPSNHMSFISEEVPVASASGPEPSALPDPGLAAEAYFAGLRLAQTGSTDPAPTTLPAQAGSAPPTAAPPSAAASDPSPADISAAAARDQGQGFRFQLAPVRWGGNIGDTVSWNRTEDVPARLRHFQTANIGAASYLWQPWFLQFSANVGVTTGTESGGETDLAASSNGRDTTIIGGGDLLLFPASRFPFTASFSRTDSRTGATALADDFINTRISLRQDYAPLRTPILYSVSYDRSVLDGEAQGKDTVDVFRGSIAWRGVRQALNVDLSHNQNSPERTAGTKFDNANVNHSWQLGERVNLVNQMTFTRSTTGVGGTGLAQEIDSTTLGVNSTASWQPDTERPLSLSGGLQYFRFEFGGSSSQSASAVLSANYSYSPNISIYGSGQLSHIETPEESDVLGLATAGINYSSDAIALGQYNYTWNASGAGTVQSGLSGETASTLTSSLGHGLDRTFEIDSRSTVSLAATQGLTWIVANPTGNSIGINNGLTGTWAFRQSENFNMRLSLGASDSRFTGESEDAYTSFIAQLDGNLFIDRYSNASAAITVQSTRQDTSQNIGAQEGFVTSIYGTMGYQHNRFFGVPRLRYSALYTGNTQELNTRAQGNLDALPRNESHSFEQRLEYRVGRLDLQALARISRIEGENNAFVFFGINRAFGAF